MIATIKAVFYLLVAAAFSWFLVAVDWESLKGNSVTWSLVGLATVGLLAFRYFGVVIWRLILRRLGARRLPPFLTLADVYAKAWLARYLPGTFPWIAGKILLASQHGISKSRLAVSSLVEAAAQIIGISAVSLGFLVADGRISDVSLTLRVLVLGALSLLLMAMIPPVFNRLLTLAFRLLRRGNAISVSWSLLAASVGLYSVGAVFSGVAYAAFAFGFVPGLQVRDSLYLIGVFGISGVVGMLTPLVPSGAGTRDSAQMLLLLIVVPPSTAALLVLCSRVWSATVDALFWGFAVGMRWLFRAPALELDARPPPMPIRVRAPFDST